MTALHTAYQAGIWDSLLTAADAALPLPNALHGGICQKSAAEALEAFSQEIRSGVAPEPKRASTTL